MRHRTIVVDTIIEDRSGIYWSQETVEYTRPSGGLVYALWAGRWMPLGVMQGPASAVEYYVRGWFISHSPSVYWSSGDAVLARRAFEWLRDQIDFAPEGETE